MLGVAQEGSLTPSASMHELVSNAAQLQRVMKPAYPTLLFTNPIGREHLKQLGGNRFFDQLVDLQVAEELQAVRLENHISPVWVNKLSVYLLSPFNRTLYMDGDVTILWPTYVDELLANPTKTVLKC